MSPVGGLRHIMRLRRAADLRFARDGLTDEVLINANLLENDPVSLAATLQRSELPVSIDPVLYRFQRPEWWRGEKGKPKGNYVDLGRRYAEDTGIDLPSGPLIDNVPDGRVWRKLAANVSAYQLTRLAQTPTQLDLLAPSRQLEVTRVMAPALVAHGHREDQVNRLLAEGAGEASPDPVALPVIVPPERLTDEREREQLIGALPSEGIASYLIWTPGVSEDDLFAKPPLLASLIALIGALAARGIRVGHLHGGYAIAALHTLGIDAIVHTVSWTDSGEPAVREGGGGPRSCKTYLPAARHCVPFDRAHAFGRSLDQAEYAARYCRCDFCMGIFARGGHPLDFLLEDHPVAGGPRRTPTQGAEVLNTYHFLLARREEFQAFSAGPGAEVLAADIELARLATDPDGAERLQRLATRVRSA